MNEMGIGEHGAAQFLVNILVAKKLLQRLLCNHQMGVSSWHWISRMVLSYSDPIVSLRGASVNSFSQRDDYERVDFRPKGC